MSTARATRRIVTLLICMVLILFGTGSAVLAQDMSIANGLNWLVTAQNIDGKWGSINGIRDTETVVNAFRDLGQTGDSSRKALDWIVAADIESNDYLARKIVSRVGSGTDMSADVQRLVSNQNPDGGWGYALDYESSAFDTSIAALALQAAGYQNNAVLTNAVAFLTSSQNADGSWSILADVPGDVTTTSLSLLAIKRCSSAGLPVQAGLIGKSVTWLSAKQNIDGGFGSSPSTTYETALALATLVEAGQIQPLPLINATNYLKAAQRANGSWNDSAYDTALALDTLAGLNPNLTISATDLSLSALTPVSGTTVTVRAVIKNTGTGAGKNVPVLFFSESPEHQLVQIGQTHIIQTIDVGATTTLTADFDTTGKSGPYTIWVKIDPDNTVSELTKTDNQTSKAINIVPLKPDFSVSNADLSILPTVPKSGETAKITVTVNNIGTTEAANIPVQISALSPDNIQTQLGTQLIPLILAGGTATVTVNFDTKGLQGNYNLHVNIDPTGTFDELLKTNNQASKPLSITAVAELTVTSFTLSKDSVNAGDDVKLTTTVSNLGNAAASSIDIAYYAKSIADENLIGKNTIPSLGLGESATRELVWKSGLAGMAMPVYAVADPRNKIPEVDKNNNQASQLIDIAAVTDANLAVSYKDISFTPSILKQGSTAVITANINNSGFAPVDTANVAMYLGDPGQNGVLIGSTSVQNILPGATAPARFSWANIPVSGSQMLYFKIDPANTVREFKKDDNDTFVMVDIRALPDLQIADNSIIITPAYPKEGDTVALDVTVLNSGEQDATYVTVQITEGGTVIGSQVIPVVAAGLTAKASFTYSTTGKIGPHQISTIIDPESIIAEQSRVNNSAKASFIVQNSKLWISERYFSPNGDDVKDSTNISFRLDAPSKVKVIVVNGVEEIDRTFSGGELDNTAGTEVVWDGKNDTGSVVDDGTYQIKLVNAENVVLASLPVEVDTNRSPLTDAIGTPYLLFNNLTCQIPDGGFSNWSWLPYDSGILFDNSYSQPGFPAGTYQMSPVGDDIWKVTPDNWSDGTFDYTKEPYSTLSPDGSRFVYVLTKYNRTSKQTTRSLLVQSVDGQGLRSLVEDSTGYFYDMNWSPDGNNLSFQLTPMNNWNADLFLINPDTGMSRMLHKGYVWNSVWSPDSTSLAFEISQQCDDAGCKQINPTLMVAGRDGVTKAIYTSPDDTFDIRWLAEGKLLIEKGWRTPQLVLVDSLNPETAKLITTETDDFSVNSRYEISPDGRSIAYLVADAVLPDPVHQSVWLADLNGESINVGDIGLALITNCEGACLNTPKMLWAKDSSKFAYVETKYREADNQIDENISVYDLGSGSINTTNISVLEASTDSYYDNPAAETPRTVNRLIAWLADDRSILIDSTEGYYAINTVTAIRSGTLPIPADSSNINLSRLQRYLVYTVYGEPNPACIDQSGWATWSIGSLLNLTADLRVSKNKSAIKLKGIAADKNFEGYRIEYADKKSPEQWHLVMPPSDTPVLDNIFTTWIPPYEGVFLVKLTVWDSAGNTAIDRKRVSWGQSASVTNIYTSTSLFSPNGDGVKETVELHYTVLEPVHLEFIIVDENNMPVRTFFKDYATLGEDNIVWDGRDDLGQMVKDGKYLIRLFDYEFQVEVDGTAPQANLIASRYFITTDPVDSFANPPLPPPVPYVASTLSASAIDKNLKRWTLEYSVEGNPAEWIEYATGDVATFKSDAEGKLVDNYSTTKKDYDIQWLLNKPFRLTVEDYSGSVTRSFAEFDQELILINSFDGGAVSIPPISNMGDIGVSAIRSRQGLAQGVHSLGMVYFLKKPIDKAYIQYEIGKDIWRDEVFDLKRGNINLTSEITAVRMRFIDTSGKVHFSNKLLTPLSSSFGLRIICGKSKEENYLQATSFLGNLSIIKLQQKTGSDTWADYYTYQGNVIPSGVFTAVLPQASGAVRMVGIDTNGIQFTTQDVQYPQVCSNVGVHNSIKYEKTSECGEMSAKALVSAYYEADVPIVPKDVKFYIMKKGVWEFLQEFDLNNQKFEDIKMPFDTTAMAEGKYPIKLLFRYLDVTRNLEQTIENPWDAMFVPDPWLIVDRKPAVINSSYSVEAQTVCPVRQYYTDETGEWFGVSAIAQARDDNYTTFEMFYGDGNNPQEWLTAYWRDFVVLNGKVQPKLIPIKDSGPNGNISPWDVTNLQSGNYSLKLKVFDAVGNVSCKTTSFTLEKASIIQSLKTDKVLFSPNGDGILDDVHIDYAIDRNATIAAKVYTLIMGDDGLPKLDGTPLRTIVTDKSYLSGTDTINWDGKDDTGAALPIGKYGIALYATNSCGVTSTKWVPVEIDVTPPFVTIINPDPALQLPPVNILDILGTTQDSHFDNFVLEAGEGSSPTTWDIISAKRIPVSNGRLGYWNTFGLTGKWTLRLSSVDTVGNRGVSQIMLDMDNRRTLIKSLAVLPEMISPNNDQKADTALIKYEVTEPSNIKIGIFDASSVLVREHSLTLTSAGMYSWPWDGKNATGTVVADGTYQIKLDVSLTASGQAQSESISLVVDNILPKIDIKQPNKVYLNTMSLSVTGEISDLNLSEYTISYSGPDGVVVLDSGNQNKLSNLFGTISDLKEDTYTLTAIAKDLAENSTKVTRIITIDRTSPKVTLDTPKSGEFYGADKRVIDITGSIIEKNLERYSLRYGAGEMPSEWRELVGGDAVPTVSNFFSWKVGKDDSIADGVYSLSMYAKDKAGLEGEAKTRIVIDNTPPDVALTSPKEGDYVTKAINIKGTIADSYFDKGTLELSEGSCKTAAKFSVIKTLSVSVQDDILDSWKVLPADGEYCLKLSASDKSGNKSETKTGFKIDTHPPAVPTLTGKTENKTTNTLSWTKSPEADVAGYNLYKNSQKLNSIAITDLAYSDTGLKEGSYVYTVKAIDLAGNESESSNTVSLKIDLTGPTARITSPRDGSVVSNLVDVKGTAFSQDDFKEYRVHIGQGSNPSSWALIRRSPLSTSYGSLAQWDTITGQEGSQYSIKLEAEDTSGNISTAQTVVTIDNTPPNSPLLLTNAVTGAEVALTWKANSETDLAGYLLYRNDQLANVSGIVAGNLKPYLVSGTTYTDKALADGTYSYYLVAMDQAGNSSDQSNTLEVTIDTRPPHMTITAPTSGHKFEGTLMIKAETPDNDIATVQFQYKRSQDVGWTNLGAPLVNSPFITYLNPKLLGLAYYDYQVQALAADKSGKPDPVPPLVTITYADLTPPDVPSGLAAKVLGAEVNLTWNAVSEAEVNYNIYRWNAGAKSRINGTAVKTLSFMDSAVPDGTYQYEVTATDLSGNESSASGQATAKIYAPIIIQPLTPVKEPALNLTGNGVDPNSAVELTTVQPSGNIAKVTVFADASGIFKLDGITLGVGETSFSAVTSDSNGNISKDSEAVYVAFGKVPAVPTGLVSTVQGNGVTLNWNANSEADILGYNIYRDGELLNYWNWVEPILATASNEEPADNAIDDNYYTSWNSSYSNDGTFSPVWWQMTFSAPELVSELDLNWLTGWDYDGNQILYAGKDFDVQAWSGHNWVTIKKIAGNDQQFNELIIDPPYRTDRLRLLITATTDPNDSRQVMLADASAYAVDINSSPSYNEIYIQDGKYLYEVSAVNQYGFESDRAAAKAKIGWFPQTPSGLAATVQGSNVILSWNPNPDTANAVSYYYKMQRWNGQTMESSWWVNALDTTYTDFDVKNGTYGYRISATAWTGRSWIESDFSDFVGATVAVVPPVVPSGLVVMAPAFGKTLDIAWQLSPDSFGYNLYRSNTHEGPYTSVDSWIDSPVYRDGGLVDGMNYYYVVTALDYAGNESSYSAEATGVPRDLIAQQPHIFKPTLPGTPVTTYVETVEVAGFAEPGASIDIKRNEATIGAATASVLEQRFDKSLLLDTGSVSLSPDRGILASVANNILTLTDLSNNAVTVTLDLPFADSWGTPLWSPSGRFLVFSGSDSNWNDKIATYDRETQQVQIVTTGVSVSEFDASWSPAIDNFVFVSADADDNRILWLGNPIDGSVTRLADANYADDPRLSHDNKYVAYFEDDETLLLFNRVDGTVTTVDSDTDGGSLAWSPDDSKLAYISYRDGDGDIYSYAISSGEVARRTYSQQDGGSIAWSPDGSWLGYRSYPDDNELFTVVDVNGSEQIVFAAVEDLYGIPEWRSDGDIIALDQLGLHTIKPAGYFSATVNLVAGENSLTAVATDPAGNASILSEAITVIFDTGTLPDLAITDSDISFFPPVSRPGEETLVTARVRNLAGNAVDNVKVELYLWDGANDVTTLASETISHIDAYGEENVAVRFNVGTANGTRTVIAVVDPSDAIQEVLEPNNYAAKDFAITNLEGVRLTATLNSLKLASNHDLSANVALLNSGLPVSGVLSVAIEDASGVVVKQLAGQTLELPYGLNESLSFTWNTGATFAGNYRLHALLKNGTTVLAEDAVSFTIIPDLTVIARIATDRQQYGANQSVGLSASFMNAALNYLIPQLKANLRIFDAQNAQLFSGEQFVANIMPGMSGALDFSWNSGLNAPGNYTAKIEYSVGDQFAGNASTAFSIIPVASINGTLKVSSNIVQPGEAIVVSYTLNNSGNSTAAGQALLVLVDPDSLSVIATMEQAVSIPMGGTQSGSAVFASGKLLLKPHLVTLTYVTLGSRTLIGTAPVSIKDGIPPVLTVVSPLSGERFTGDVSFSVLASDNASGVARVEYSRDGGAWSLLPPTEPAEGRYGFVWTPVVTENGLHSVSFRGADRAGNTGSPLVVSFIVQIDTTPPVLNVSTLADGSFTNNQVLNIAGSVSDDTGVKVVTINGTIITINSDGSFSHALQLVPVSNSIEVRASDFAGNSFTDVRTINLDQKAPLLVILTPADNSKTGAPLMDVTGVVDESSTVTVKAGGVVQTTAMNGNGFTSSVTLVPGINTIEVTATDLASNTSSQKRTVIFDDQKPALAISEPGQDLRTNKGNVTVHGTVSDPYTEVSVTVSVDDQTFTPIVIDGRFEQAVSFSAEKSYTITVTATNEVGSATSSQRNVVYDITPPTVSIDPVVSPTSQTSQAISGVREEGTAIVVSCATATIADIEYPSATIWRTMLSGFTAAGNSVVAIATDAAGNFSTATTAIVYDTAPPTGSIVINGGAGVTASDQVLLSLAANDESDVLRMRFSNDGSAWGDPETYATTRGWFLASGDGLKRVYVSYQDMAGNWSVVPIVADIVLDTIPPVVSASPGGGVYNGTRSVTLVANEPAVIRYTVDGSAPNATSAVYQTPIQITSDTVLRFMANDSVGNLSDSKTEIYTIDTIPPSLTVSTLTAGSYTNNQVLNVAGLATDSSGIVSLALNGANVSQSKDGTFSQALVLQPGGNAVTVVATDLVGNSSSDSRTINLDMTSPLLIITAPADNAKTATDVMNVTGTVDETSTVMVTLGTSVQQAAMDGTGFSAPVGLNPGINTIDVTATDLAGNTSTQKRTVVYDDQKPSLAVTDPLQDFRTNQSGLILRGTVSDLYTQVGVAVTMEGQIHTPQVVGGAFEQQLSFVQEKSYAIVVTATNEVGSNVTTQRNVIYDITPPTLAINPVQSPTTANSVLISGTRETDVAVTVTCSTATVGTIVYSTASSWEVQLSAMSLGENIVTAQATDAANNVSTTSVGIIVQQSGADIVLTPSPVIIWPPNHKMVPVTINGVLNVPLSNIKSLRISLTDDYGEYNFTNLKLGSTVLLEAWRNGNDLDGRKYTFTAILTRKNGSKSTATAVVLVPHDKMGGRDCDDETDDNHRSDR